MKLGRNSCAIILLETFSRVEKGSPASQNLSNLLKGNEYG